MAVTLVTGALGAGKGLYCSMLAVSGYRNGRRVAANYPLDMAKLDKRGTVPVSVIPKQFTYDDLMSLGRGCPDSEFENLGILLIDEVSLSLNARTFKDADRIKFIDWFVHSRKYGWDVYCQVQQSFMLDKQIVDGVAEFIVELSRLDSLRIPFVTAFLELLFPRDFGRTANKKSLLPHMVKHRTYLAKERGKKLPIEKGSFRAKDFFGVHDTLSAFGSAADEQGAYSLLPAASLTVAPVVTSASVSLKRKVVGLLQFVAVIAIPVAIYWFWFGRSPTDKPLNANAAVTASASSSSVSTPNAPAHPATPPVKPLSQTLRLMGHITVHGQTQLILKDMPSGLVRYQPIFTAGDFVPSDTYEIGGERVTRYSGTATIEPSSLSGLSLPNPLAP